jgi:hypothetical protein
VKWSGRATESRAYFERRRRQNPELAKAVAYVQKYVAQARDLLDAELTPPRSANARERLEELTRRADSERREDPLDRCGLGAGKRAQARAAPRWGRFVRLGAARIRGSTGQEAEQMPSLEQKLRTLIAARMEGSVTESAQLDAVRSLSAGIYESGREGIWKAMWVAASASALGATLSGTFRVRAALSSWTISVRSGRPCASNR